jgi:hypothetical protein
MSYSYPDRSAGGNTLFVTDFNGCNFQLVSDLSDENLLTINGFELTYPTATGKSDGALEAMVSGGDFPLSFQWEELLGAELNNNAAMLSNIPSGHYELTVFENSGCEQSDRVYLPGCYDLLLEQIAIQHETSYKASNGAALFLSDFDSIVSLRVIDATNHLFTYSVADSTTLFYAKEDTLYLQNLAAGDYFISATNPEGTLAYAEFEILEYEMFEFSDSTIIHVQKIDEASGSISATFSGGVAPYQVVWTNLELPSEQLNVFTEDSKSVLSDALAGSYQITVVDDYGNEISQTFTIAEPASALKLSVAEIKNASCYSYADAFVTLNAEGGWGNYQFGHDKVSGFLNGNSFVDLEVREHPFYLVDEYGALDSLVVSITQPDLLTSQVEFVDSVNCYGNNDGEIEFAIRGGTVPYRLKDLNAAFDWATDSVAHNLSHGNYTYIFTDINGCIGQDTLTVYMPQPDSLLFAKVQVVHTTCNTNNGSIQVAMQGGTPDYTYKWTNFKDEVIGTEANITQLAQDGYYILEVNDVHGCSQKLEQRIQPSTNPIILDVDTTAVLCFGDSTGTAFVVDAQPGNPYAPYSFFWSNGDTGSIVNGYAQGIYSVSVRDTNGCSSVKYFEVTQPNALDASVINTKDALCYGYSDGLVEVEASGGVGEYVYRWSNGDTTALADSLSQGVYDLILMDDNLCVYTHQYAIEHPAELQVDLGDDITMCPGNTLTIDGQDFFTHQWSSDQGIISNERYVSLSDENSYYLQVTNEIGCFAHDTLTITIGNNALQADFLMTSEACLGDSLMIFELSNLPLDSMRWEYSNEAFLNITDSITPDYILSLLSVTNGIYNVDLWAYSGGCISNVTKQVEIIDKNDSIDDGYDWGYQDPLIQSFVISPNPNDGTFMVNIGLREAADVKVVVYSVNYGQSVHTRTESGLQEYVLSYQLTGLTTGMYVVMLNAGDERKQIKIIIE